LYEPCFDAESAVGSGPVPPEEPPDDELELVEPLDPLELVDPPLDDPLPLLDVSTPLDDPLPLLDVSTPLDEPLPLLDVSTPLEVPVSPLEPPVLEPLLDPLDELLVWCVPLELPLEDELVPEFDVSGVEDPQAARVSVAKIEAQRNVCVMAGFSLGGGRGFIRSGPGSSVRWPLRSNSQCAQLRIGDARVHGAHLAALHFSTLDAGRGSRAGQRRRRSGERSRRFDRKER
jgi:hypothetical protein